MFKYILILSILLSGCTILTKEDHQRLEDDFGRQIQEQEER